MRKHRQNHISKLNEPRNAWHESAEAPKAELTRSSILRHFSKKCAWDRRPPGKQRCQTIPRARTIVNRRPQEYATIAVTKSTTEPAAPDGSKITFCRTRHCRILDRGNLPVQHEVPDTAECCNDAIRAENTQPEGLPSTTATNTILPPKSRTTA